MLLRYLVEFDEPGLGESFADSVQLLPYLSDLQFVPEHGEHLSSVK